MSDTKYRDSIRPASVVMLRKNISTRDIRCQCGCGFQSVSPAILDVVQECRDHFCKPVHINSGNHSACRCDIHNDEVGGSKTSQHLPDDITEVCRAVDFHIEGVSVQELYSYLLRKYKMCLGIGKYKTFVHVDDRMTRAYRWNYSDR